MFLFATGCQAQTSGFDSPSSKPWLEWSKSQPTWVEKVEPFHVVGNIYFVGSKGIGVYLISSDQGHALLDGGMPQFAPQIIENIKTLGFDIKDVKYLLNSHAHFDHSGGLAALKEASNAKLLAHEGDVSALEGGFYLGSENDKYMSAPKVEVDQKIEDGFELDLGEITLKARLTPGHSRGCTTWTTRIEDADQELEILFFCSATVAGNSLIPEQYEGIIEDYRYTFETTKLWRPDIPLANHPGFFDLWSKRASDLKGEENPYFDRDAFPRLMKKLNEDFERKLVEAKG